MSLTVKIKKLDPEATLPSYAHPGDAGMDVFALETTTIGPGEIAKVRTGIAIQLPEGYVSLVWDKSGVAATYGIKTVGGVIDASYRGEYIIGMINLSKAPFTFEKHHKVAQILIQKVERAELLEALSLSDSSRSASGFGSTGK